MIAQTDCPFCCGNGRIHSPGRNGDPWDDGVTCPECDGVGVVDVELEDADRAAGVGIASLVREGL